MDYIDIKEIPVSRGNMEKWPYRDWARDIPPGKALELTDQLNGASPAGTASTLHQAFKRMNSPLKAIRRGDRLFIVNGEES